MLKQAIEILICIMKRRRTEMKIMPNLYDPVQAAEVKGRFVCICKDQRKRKLPSMANQIQGRMELHLSGTVIRESVKQ